jgi:hypothetical protein
LGLLLHAVLVALTDHGDDEIHEDDVPDHQNEEPEEPGEDFEFFGPLNHGGGVVVPDGLTQDYDEEGCRLDACVAISRVLDDDMRHDGQASDDEEEVEEEDKELLEDNEKHSHQEADLGPDPDQETELDEAEDHYEELETLQDILLLWLCESYREICNIYCDE